MDNIELQIGVLDANVEELTRSVHLMLQDLRALFMIQGFVPLSLQPLQDEQQDDAPPQE